MALADSGMTPAAKQGDFWRSGWRNRANEPFYPL